MLTALFQITEDNDFVSVEVSMCGTWAKLLCPCHGVRGDKVGADIGGDTL